MAKKELTIEQREYRLDCMTLNNQFSYYINKSKCFGWNLRKANDEYAILRLEHDHFDSFQIIVKRMFELGKNN